MVKLTATIENSISSQTLCQLELWQPPQGSIPEALPISIDLDFDVEDIHFATTSFTVTAQKALVHLRTQDADVVRGTRLGEHVLDPNMVAEVTQSVRLATESETGTEGRIEVEVAPNFLGRLIGTVFWKKRKSKRAELDHIIKAAFRVSRIIPRTAGRWAILEPVRPHILKGRFIGTDGEDEIGPLCLLTMREDVCLVQVVISANRDDLNIRQTSAPNQTPRSKNKKAVLSQMIRRSISFNQVTDFTVPPNIGHESIVLAQSRMEIAVEDE